MNKPPERKKKKKHRHHEDSFNNDPNNPNSGNINLFVPESFLQGKNFRPAKR